MQKNRTALVAGILALALVLGGIAVYRNQQAQKAPATAVSNLSDEPSTAASTTPADKETAASTEEKTTTGGNTTDSKAKDETKSATTLPETHTVAKGDTLRDIAKHYYGDPVYSGDIERVNELDDPNNIPVGKVLKLPRREELNNTPAAAPATDKTDSTDKTDKTELHDGNSTDSFPTH